MDTNKKNIIYIAGYGRSGSTLLDVILGEDIVSVGEISNIYNQLYVHKIPCSCGSKLEKCSFWKRVIEKCIDPKNSKFYINLFKQQNILAIFNLFRNKKIQSEYVDVNKCLINAISEIKDSKIIIDSSKTDRNKFFRPFMLKSFCYYKVKIVHLIRDPRGVYDSILKGDNIKLEKGENPQMSFPLLRTINGWMLANTAAWLNRVLLKKESSILVRYEDLISSPLTFIQQLENKFNLNLNVAKNKIENNVPFSPGHLCGANRLARKENIVIEPGYLRTPNISKWKQVLIWFLTLPFSFLYGYPMVYKT